MDAIFKACLSVYVLSLGSIGGWSGHAPLRHSVYNAMWFVNCTYILTIAVGMLST